MVNTIVPLGQNHIFVKRGNRAHRYMLEPILLFVIQTLFPCNLAHKHCDVRQCIGAQLIIVVDYAHFAQNKFGSMSITTLIQYSMSDHFQLCIPHMFDQAQLLQEFLS